MAFPFYHQLENTDCGPTCLQMIAAHYGKKYNLQELRDICKVTRVGVTLQDISFGAKAIGLDAFAIRLSLDNLKEKIPLPCILHWRQGHFVVVYDIKKTRDGHSRFHIADPGFGLLKLNEKELLKEWEPSEGKGIAMVFEPNEQFKEHQPKLALTSQWKRSVQFARNYTSPHKQKLFWVALTLMIGAVISWIFPVLMQRLIDDGVMVKNMNVIWIILLAQLALFFGQGVIQWIRGILLVKLSMTISIDMITDLLKKLIRLPIRFFDTKLYTDLFQRVDDQARIEEFISYQVIQTLFSFISLLVLSILLLVYSPLIYLIFVLITGLSVLWVLAFLQKRKYLDYTRFSLQSENQNHLFEIITGMPEIKINSAQDKKVGLWEGVQRRLYRLKMRALNLNQYQILGVNMLTQMKNITITFLCAYWVIQDTMTLGVMMSISYIMGQLTGPVDDMVAFSRHAQDAKLSFDRMDEIQKREDEVTENLVLPPTSIQQGIQLKNVAFKYEGNFNPLVLQEIAIKIPKGKITALIGASGSGKTTLMKLLLKFYDPTEGDLYLDDINMRDLNADAWRKRCGVVMQDGFIYSGTIGENIALSDESPNAERIAQASKVACLYDFIQQIPMKFDTKVGRAGVDLSGGQKQRLLIARAVYKNPDFLFFDEATSALDANHEKQIMNNLNDFFVGKTVVVIAHRLSTVRNADQIIVLDHGHVVEIGNHDELTAAKKYYYELVKNQLELGA